ncbi:MAG: hypothetical protein LBB21_00740 [Holosporaceae bacterium]|jgi:hypothetical protein|nr:hypothetical protein [Holosporaceae bacterium]
MQFRLFVVPFLRFVADAVPKISVIIPVYNYAKKDKVIVVGRVADFIEGLTDAF